VLIEKTFGDSLVEALRELGRCLNAVDVPEGVVATFPSLSQIQKKLFVTVLQADSATDAGAPNTTMRLQPTDLLLKCLTAARAKEWPGFIILVQEALPKEGQDCLADLPEGLE
jgi:hypothetical protein